MLSENYSNEEIQSFFTDAIDVHLPGYAEQNIKYPVPNIMQVHLGFPGIDETYIIFDSIQADTNTREFHIIFGCQKSVFSKMRQAHGITLEDAQLIGRMNKKPSNEKQKTTARFYSDYMFLLDGTIPLLDHQEIVKYIKIFGKNIIRQGIFPTGSLGVVNPNGKQLLPPIVSRPDYREEFGVSKKITRLLQSSQEQLLPIAERVNPQADNEIVLLNDILERIRQILPKALFNKIAKSDEVTEFEINLGNASVSPVMITAGDSLKDPKITEVCFDFDVSNNLNVRPLEAIEGIKKTLLGFQSVPELVVLPLEGDNREICSTTLYPLRLRFLFSVAIPKDNTTGLSDFVSHLVVLLHRSRYYIEKAPYFLRTRNNINGEFDLLWQENLEAPKKRI